MGKKILFEFIFDSGKGRHIKIYSDGTYEGLPPNTVVINRFAPIVHQIINEIRINLQ